MTAKHDCSGQAYDPTGWHRCFRNATVQRDGEWWCWQHDPERVKANKEKRQARWQAKMDRKDAEYTRIARNAKLAALVTPELAAMLERLAKFASGAGEWYDEQHSDDSDNAGTLAARIREALALEPDDA